MTPALLRPAADTLAAWHLAHGRRTVVLDLQDVYDEFNNGIRHPVAVRQMLAWAAANWTAPAPTYLVLMGDGHFNLKGYTAAAPYYAPAPNPFPPYLIFKDPWLGEIPSDGLFGDITGDDLPDVAVGRIPVEHPGRGQLRRQQDRRLRRDRPRAAVAAAGGLRRGRSTRFGWQLLGHER